MGKVRFSAWGTRRRQAAVRLGLACVLAVGLVATANVNKALAAEPGAAESQPLADGATVTHVVSTADDLTKAYENIAASPDAEATIELTTNVTPAEDGKATLGVAGKHVTYTSSEGGSYSLSTVQPHLVGDVTVQNVALKGGSVFAEGHTLEFGEQYNGTGLRLYGGSDQDLDLTTNDDADGSTHLIIRAGKFKSIVGGNKDTFTQGENHEYADWSDPDENKHTTLTGDVLIEVYGGSFGGSYNIDVGDTCCNTDVTPCKLYGGGLGSDTIGDVTINVYGLDAASGYNCNIVGGGFGMAGGADDQTLYVDAIKHTGIVNGNVNLNLLGGNIAEFYGGGWPGGSAYKKQLNVSSERAAQRQYHREEVAVVTGDVNIVMGGTMTLCQNQSQGWGGSYASTIKGDVNVTIKDNAKLAARYALNNGGAPTPQSMNDLDGTYAQYYDGMYTGSGWDSGFYACGQYDIICGSVNVDIQGGYAWSVQGTPFTDPFAELPVAKTEIRNEKGAPYGIDITVSGGMVHDLWGDYEGGKIADGIRYTQTGGEVFSVNVFDGRNSSLKAGSKVDVVMSGGVVYNMVGQYSRMRDGVTSTITFEPGTGTDPVKLGYLVGFNQVTAAEGSNTLIDAVAVMEAYQIDPKKYGATSDVPFYENVYDLSVEKDALLTTCKTDTNLLGDAEVSGGTWIAYGPVTIGESVSQSGGTVFLAQPSEVKGNAAFSGNAELRLPVVNDNNYAGSDDPAIPLRIGGTASGVCQMLTVDADDWTSAVAPAEGDNYIVGFAPNGTGNGANQDNPVQGTFVLGNDDAVAQGYFLKRVTDPGNAANYMWRVAKGEPPATLVAPTAVSLTAYEGGEGSEANAADALPDPVWRSDAEGWTVTVDGAAWDVAAQGAPFQWGYFPQGSDDEQTNAAKHGVYKLRAWALEGDPEVLATDADGSRYELDLGEEPVVVSDAAGDLVTVSVRDVTADDAAVDGLSEDVFKDVFGYDSSAASGASTLAAGDGLFNEFGTQDGTCSQTEPHAHVPEGTTLYKNGNPQLPLESGAKIALLWDELLSDVLGADAQAQALHAKALAAANMSDPDGHEFKYTDLVDMADGNVWVGTAAAADGTPGAATTVFWPYPEGVTDDDEVAVVRFTNLTRDYTVTMNEDALETAVASSTAEKLAVTKTDTGVLFEIPSQGFGPIEMLWEGNGGGGVTPPPSGGDPDDSESSLPDFDVDKKLTGRGLVDGEFDFAIELVKGDKADVSTACVNGENDAEGNVTFEGGVVFKDEGVFEFELSEVLPADDDPEAAGTQHDGVTYDEDTYRLVATVTEDEAADKLVVSWDAPKSVAFENVYEDGENPDVPDTPDTPDMPDEPEDPDTPQTPSGPEEPDADTDSDVPSLPDTGDIAPIAMLAIGGAGTAALAAGVLMRRRK